MRVITVYPGAERRHTQRASRSHTLTGRIPLFLKLTSKPSARAAAALAASCRGGLRADGGPAAGVDPPRRTVGPARRHAAARCGSVRRERRDKIHPRALLRAGAWSA